MPDNDLEDEGGPPDIPISAEAEAEAKKKDTAVIWVSDILGYYVVAATSSPATHTPHVLVSVLLQLPSLQAFSFFQIPNACALSTVSELFIHCI